MTTRKRPWFGLRVQLESPMSSGQARRALRKLVSPTRRRFDDLWGFRLGPLVYLQAGLGPSAAAVICSMRGHQSGVQFRGLAGINIGSLVLIGTGFTGLVLWAVGRWLLWSNSGTLWFIPFATVLMLLVFWSNRFFHGDAAGLVHQLHRALQSEKLTRADRDFDTRPRDGACLAINGDSTESPASAYDVREAILRLYTDQFVIISFAEQQYMQVLKEGDLYRLEWRDGAPDRHWQLGEKLEQDDVVAAMTTYLQTKQPPPSLCRARIAL